jgi:hypothetical protein
MRPRAVANCLWALSKLQLKLPQQLLQMLLHRASCELGFSRFEPRQLCIVAYALVQLQEQGLFSVTNNSSSSSSSSGRDQLYSPVLLDDMFTALGAGLSNCSAHDMAQAVYALARLRHVPPQGWLAAWLQRAQQLLPQFTAQGLANAAYGLAAVMWQAGYIIAPNNSSSSDSSRGLTLPQQQHLLAAARVWLQACLRVSLLHLPFLQPSELFGQLLWAAGKLRCALPQPAGHHLLLKTQALLPECDAAHLSIALYCFAVLGQTPTQTWLQCFWQRVRQELLQFSALHVSRMLWSAEVLQLQLPEGLGWRLQQRVERMVAHAGEVKHIGRLGFAAS